MRNKILRLITILEKYETEIILWRESENVANIYCSVNIFPQYTINFSFFGGVRVTMNSHFSSTDKNRVDNKRTIVIQNAPFV